jgi:hypothetical protein
MPYYNQTEKEDSDNNDTGWRSISKAEQDRYRKMKEQVSSFIFK